MRRCGISGGFVVGSMLASIVLSAGLCGAAGPSFRQVEDGWGLDFVHHGAASGRYYMVETQGGGLVAFDYDGDGDTDLFAVDGGPLPGYQGAPPASRLYRNDGGRFVDVTAAAGIEVAGYGSGGAAADIDGDGDLDLLLTLFGPDQLWRNRGDGSFEEVGAQAGIADPSWGTSAAFADVDGDGDLDLYVANYVDFSLDHNVACGDQQRALRGYCGPDVYRPQADHFYRNRGDGSFEEATEAAGMAVAPGAGLALSFGDLDGDGWVDLYVANDLTPNFLFRNRGDGTFAEVGLLSGTSHGPRGQPEAGMGVALGDVDGNGWPDVVVTNYEGETNALYSQRSRGIFTDHRFVSGLGEPTLRSLAFGVAAADFDSDGDLDLVFANGHVRENAALFNPSSRYAQRNQLFENLTFDGLAASKPGRFREVLDGGLDTVLASRSLSLADFDGDGDQDLVVGNVDGPLEVYENLGLQKENQGPRKENQGLRKASTLRLRGMGSPQDGSACLVFGTEQEGAGQKPGSMQCRQGWSNTSYLSQHGPELHFGAGVEAPASLSLWRPDGRRWRLLRPALGYRLVWPR